MNKEHTKDLKSDIYSMLEHINSERALRLLKMYISYFYRNRERSDVA